MTETLDTRGLKCPLPVLKARKRMAAMADGAELTMIATDPASVIDVPHFCNTTGHLLVSQHEAKGEYTFVLRCVKRPPSAACGA